MRLNPSMIGIVVLVLGLVAVLSGVYLAYEAYLHYKPVLPKAVSLDQAITNTTYELVNLVLKLGFLGIVLWGGSVMLKNGLSTVIEVHRIDRGYEECSARQKQGSR